MNSTPTTIPKKCPYEQELDDFGIHLTDAQLAEYRAVVKELPEREVVDKSSGFHSSRGFRVYQVAEQGGALMVFGSIGEASRKTGVPRSTIQDCLKGRLKTAGGYKWKKES